MCFNAARAQRKAPRTSTANCRSKSSSANSRESPPENVPAEKTSTSRSRWDSIVPATTRSTASGSVTSSSRYSQAPPPARTNSSVGSGPSFASRVRDATTTSAPSAPNRSAIPRPMPEVPPTTSATLPSSRPSLDNGDRGYLMEIALHPERGHGDRRPGRAAARREDLRGDLHGVLPRARVLVEGEDPENVVERAAEPLHHLADLREDVPDLSARIAGGDDALVGGAGDLAGNGHEGAVLLP